MLEVQCRSCSSEVEERNFLASKLPLEVFDLRSMLLLSAAKKQVWCRTWSEKTVKAQNVATGVERKTLLSVDVFRSTINFRTAS